MDPIITVVQQVIMVLATVDMVVQDTEWAMVDITQGMGRDMVAMETQGMGRVIMVILTQATGKAMEDMGILGMAKAMEWATDQDMGANQRKYLMN